MTLPRAVASLAVATALAATACSTTRSSAAVARPARTSTPEQAPATRGTLGRSVPKDEFEERCASGEIACRKDLRLSLKHKNGSAFDRFWAWFPPVIQAGILTILPGERLLVEATVAGDCLVLARVVERPEHPERTLELRFQQGFAASDEVGMMLEIRSPFPRPLKYDAGMMLLDGPAEVLATSSCPLRPNLAVFESWPDPIFQLVLQNFRFVGESELACE